MGSATWRRLGFELLATYAVSLGVFAWLVVPRTGLLDVDPYYHFTVSRLIGQSGPWLDIPWLPLTAVGPNGPDAHWGWHALCAPLTWLFADPFESLKWCIAATASLVPTTLYAVARTRGVSWPALWAALAVTGGLIMPARLLVLRAQTLAVCFIALHLVAMAGRRWRLLGVLSFLFMQAYHGAVIVAPIVIGWVLIVAVRHRRFEWQPLVWSAGGGALALVASPWVPDNVEYLFFHTLYTAASHTASDPTGAAVEWLAPTGWAPILNVWPAHAALLSGLVAMVWAGRRRGAPVSEAAPLWVASSGLFFLMYLGARRFAEYYVPVSVLAGAILLRDAGVMTTRRGNAAVALALVAVLAWQIPRDVDVVQRLEVFGPDRFARIGAWIDEHAEPGELVYNAAYDSFPMLVYHAPQQQYVAGLDPRYLQYGDPDRFELWQRTQQISADEPTDPAPLLAGAFGIRWIVAESQFPGLRCRLRNSSAASEVLSTEWGSLYRVH